MSEGRITSIDDPGADADGPYRLPMRLATWPAPAMTARRCLCTCPDPEVATYIAQAPVAQRLAARVTLVPVIGSVYCWQGKIDRMQDVQLVIKTVRSSLETLTARVVELHPHELPEVITVEVAGGLAANLDGIGEQTCVETDR